MFSILCCGSAQSSCVRLRPEEDANPDPVSHGCCSEAMWEKSEISPKSPVSESWLSVSCGLC